MAPNRKWTPEEVQKLEDLIGVYNTTTIAHRMKRSFDSVHRKARSLNMTTADARSSKGMTPKNFAEIFGVNKKTVTHWARVGILPKVKLPYFQKIGKRQPDWILIDDTKIEEWLMTGYVYHRDINPTDQYYTEMVRRVRKKLDFEWISSKDFIACLEITPKVVNAWVYRHAFPRLVFWSSGMSISMYNRKAVIDWCLSHPKQVKPTKVRELLNYGIGKGL